ncbi:MAG TPA: Uma2 family endonuclease [Gemmataceae bacterium]|jgi:Uma2 family endonuclease
MKRASNSNAAKNGNSRRAEQPDPFRFGWRYVQHISPDGPKVSVRTPLTLDDVLHPREGDRIPENSQQENDRIYLATVLRYRLAGNPHALVLSDCLIDWGVRGLRNHSPDISVFDGVQGTSRHWGTFVVAAEGARPLLAIEVVSPDAHDRQARDNDVVTKVREYYRARVPLYGIVDQERVDGPRRIIGYRRGARKYVPVPLDDRGRLLMEPPRLLLGLRDERAVCWDADTGEEIPDLTGMAQARQAAETALAAAQARIRELEARTRNGGRRS